MEGKLLKESYNDYGPCIILDRDVFLQHLEEIKKAAEWLQKFDEEHPGDLDKIIDCLNLVCDKF